MGTVWVALMLLGAEGCGKDLDCKGDRICENGACVSPSPVPVASPASPPPSYVPGQERRGLLDPPTHHQEAERPPVEFGWMAFEASLGMFTSAALTVLPYFLLFNSGSIGDPTVSSAIFILVFCVASAASAGVQLAVSGGSRIYRSLAVPPFLAGLVGTAAVLGLFYASGWLPSRQASGGVPNGGSVGLLMVGSIVVVPLLQTVVINIFKYPKGRPVASLGDPVGGHGVAFSLPMIAPVIAPGAGGVALGAQLSFLRGNF